MTRSGEPKLFDSGFSQASLVRTALQGPRTLEGCSVFVRHHGSEEARKRGGGHWQGD